MFKVAVWLLAILAGGSTGFVDHSDDSTKLLSKIDEGRDHLKNESVKLITGQIGTRRVRIGRRRYLEVPITGILAREMAVAILDGEGKIRIVRAIKRDPGFEV